MPFQGQPHHTNPKHAPTHPMFNLQLQNTQVPTPITGHQTHSRETQQKMKPLSILPHSSENGTLDSIFKMWVVDDLPFLCIFTKQVEKLLFLFISKQNPTLKVCTQTPKQSLEQTRRLHHSNKAPGSITCTKHIYRASPRTPFTGSYTQGTTWC